MTIIEQGGDYSKRDIYNMTRSPRCEKLSNHTGEVFSVDKYLIYLDGDEENSNEILSIESNGLVVVTNSITALREFRAIKDIMGDEPFSVEVMTGTSKNGRTYYTLALA